MHFFFIERRNVQPGIDGVNFSVYKIKIVHQRFLFFCNEYCFSANLFRCVSGKSRFLYLVIPKFSVQYVKAIGWACGDRCDNVGHFRDNMIMGKRKSEGNVRRAEKGIGNFKLGGDTVA